MRALKIICGIAVIITTLHLGHAVQHFYAHHVHDSVQRLAMGAAILMGLLSFVGGLLLIKG